MQKPLICHGLGRVDGNQAMLSKALKLTSFGLKCIETIYGGECDTYTDIKHEHRQAELPTANELWGGGVAQLVERRTLHYMTRVRIPPGAHIKPPMNQKCCADSLSV